MSAEEERRTETDGGVETATQSSDSKWLVDLPIDGYEAGERCDYSTYSSLIHRRFRAFVGALAGIHEIERTRTRVRHPPFAEPVETFENDRGRVLDRHNLGDDDAGVLLVFPDHARMYVGLDATATDSGLFGFVVTTSDPIATPDTCQQALDLLKPAGVAQRLDLDPDGAARQGEWWLLPADDEPVSEAFNPGLASKPYGGSPLENHVPREYAFGVTADELLRRFDEAVPERAGDFETVPELVEWLHQQRRFDDTEDIEIPDYVPTYDDLREWAEEVYVRGTLRHRENDHYMKSIGEEWHVARTHSLDVYTLDITPDAPVTARYD